MKTSGQSHQKVHIVTYLICVIQVYGFFLYAVAIPTSSTTNPLYIKDGESFNITCEVVKDAQGVHWLRNGSPVLSITNTTTCSFNKWPSPHTYNYSVTCDQQKRFSMVRSGFNRSDDNTTWSCKVDGLDYGDLGTSLGVRVYIYITVGSVQLKNGTNLALIENQSAVLVCETDACRPSAAIFWMKNGIQITDPPTNFTVTETTVGSEMFVSIGTLNYKGQRRDNGTLLTCGGYNELDSVKTSANLTITIYYPPSIEALTSPYKVIENNPLNVTCLATSNPPADWISWFPKGEGTLNSILYFRSVSRNNSGIYNCTAKNTMIPTVGTQQNGTNTSQIEVDVLYPPSIQGLTSLYKVIEKQRINVTCEVSSNPPPYLISWSPTGEGSVTSILYFQSVSRNISGNYSCTAQNTMIPTGGIQQNGTVTNQMQVDVMYPPSIDGLNSSYKVIENDPLNVICVVKSNPPADQIFWSPSGEGAANSTLHYRSVSRNNSGIYYCTAQNTMVPTVGSPETGTNTSQIQVDVLYGASVSNLSVYVNNTINENSSAIFNCHVDSHPPSTITWMKEGSSDALKTESGVVQSNYTIKSAECLDMGNYTCTAYNGIRTGAKKVLELFVRCHPRTDFRLNLTTKIYKKRHEAANLMYRVIAYPTPTFTWTFFGNGSETRVLNVSASHQNNGQQSELNITSLDITDFGNYSVIANNSLFPSAMVVFEIIQADFPDVPSNVTIIEITQTSVKVQWMAGYNGGPQQTFHIVASAGNSNHSNTTHDPGYRQTGTAVLNGLLPGTNYSIYVVAINSIGPSNSTEAINITTGTWEERNTVTEITTIFPLAEVAGGIGSGVGVILVVALVLFLVRRYRNQKRYTDGITEEETERTRPDSGLVDNPVYDTSGPLPGPSASAGITEDEYAKVSKPKKKAPNMDEPSNIYAQVKKTKKNFKKDADKGKHGKMSRGDIYENAADLVANTKAEPCDESLYEDAGATGSNGPIRNKDGLHYADLMLGPPSKKDGKDIIRGIENRTEYAEIAYGKRGEPLPDSDN